MQVIRVQIVIRLIRAVRAKPSSTRLTDDRFAAVSQWGVATSGCCKNVYEYLERMCGVMPLNGILRSALICIVEGL